MSTINPRRGVISMMMTIHRKMPQPKIIRQDFKEHLLWLILIGMMKWSRGAIFCSPMCRHAQSVERGKCN